MLDDYRPATDAEADAWLSGHKMLNRIEDVIEDATLGIMVREEILDCGHRPTYPRSQYTTGYSTDSRTGKTACFDCSNRQEAEAFAAAERYAGYIDMSGSLFTTWPGGILGHVVGHTVTPFGFYGAKVHRWWIQAPDGSRWYGQNGGTGMVVDVRKLRRS